MVLGKEAYFEPDVSDGQLLVGQPLLKVSEETACVGEVGNDRDGLPIDPLHARCCWRSVVEGLQIDGRRLKEGSEVCE